MGSEKIAPAQAQRHAVAFTSGREADRRVAGVAAAARIVHTLAQAGAGETWLTIGDGAPLAPATLQDIERLRGMTEVRIVAPAEAPADLEATPAPALSAMAILRATAKPGDGIVSRFFNRPISQRISWAVLAMPGARPIHATIASAVFALILFWGMLAGGKTGLILGGILFQAASIIDGVDGEMARATFRATDFGKTLDSAVDMATNFLFLLGLTVHLGRHGSYVVLWAGLWSLSIMVVGGILVGVRSRAGGAPLSFDLLKRSGRIRGPVDLIFWVMQTLTSRDCYAFLFMVLIIAGLAAEALMVGALVGTIWMLYVFAALLLPRPSVGFRGAA
jgi:1L-myo-inositol 1-phosphate cytidylyltransferase / CDP-L-myo-inositol myo-inositolphosphotransferase